MKGWSFHSLAVVLSMAGAAVMARAQSSTNPPPVVTVVATDANGSEDGPDSATFQVTRAGSTNDSITVYYSLGGTARNGRDFRMLPGTVTIPAGAASADITIQPLLDVDTTRETNETVVLQLHPLVDFPRGRLAPYALGWPSNAVANIAESANPPTNQPPLVQIVSPADGAGFVAPANVQLVAQARDPDGTVASVEFFAGTTSLGVVTNNTSGERFRGLYSLDWTNAAAGNYVVTAVATDNGGATNVSAAVNVHLLSAADIPVITVAASQPDAAELGPKKGAFTLTRTGDTTGPLSVYYSLRGSAVNGADYQRLPGIANFAAGSNTVDVTVTPVPDLDPVGHTNDTVVLQLQRLVDTLRPGSRGFYQLGSPSNAVVTITEDNSAFPVVTVQTANADAAEDGPKAGTFSLTRTGNTGSPLTVLYSLGGTGRNGRDYQMLPGYVTFAAGDTTTNITVTPILDYDTTPETNETVVLQLRPSIDANRGRPGPASSVYGLGFPSNAVINIAESTAPHTNQPPVVRLLNPAEGAGYVAPANIQLLAQASDLEGKVSNVEFFADSKSLGVVTNQLTAGRNRGLFSLNWTNVPIGQYALTAVATDNQGAGSTSGPVHVVVTQTALPSVSIFASNPIALRGTNALGQTNSAIFTVRRNTGTNADLVVYYTESGTATNGVDYAKLSGSVTIPAGRYTAPISIDPLSDTHVTGALDQTVILTLQAAPTSAQNPPSYTLGRPQAAVGLIANRAGVRQVPGWVRNGMFHAVVPVQAPASYRLEVSTDLVNWEPVGTNSVTQDALQYVDPDAATPLRFYRAVPQTDEAP